MSIVSFRPIFEAKVRRGFPIHILEEVVVAKVVGSGTCSMDGKEHSRKL